MITKLTSDHKTAFILACIIGAFLSGVSEASETGTKKGQNRIDLSQWQLVWQDDFDYSNKELDKNWESQNGPSGHILCSRWRENAVVADGILQLINLKEQRGGQEWTSGNIWTKRKFKYGYFECRYRYAAAPGTNNSFRLMTRGLDPDQGKRFEIDINEGHYPNEGREFCHSEVPIWLSLAVIPWAGPVTDAIDGTSMKVDWVRYYQKKGE